MFIYTHNQSYIHIHITYTYINMYIYIYTYTTGFITIHSGSPCYPVTEEIEAKDWSWDTYLKASQGRRLVTVVRGLMSNTTAYKDCWLASGRLDPPNSTGASSCSARFSDGPSCEIMFNDLKPLLWVPHSQAGSTKGIIACVGSV